MLSNTFLPPKSSLHFQSLHHPFRPSLSSLKPFIVASVKTAKSSATTLYQVLHIKENASQTEIKAAYRNLAKMYHPDATCSTSDSKGWDFIELHNAYATLSDPVARAHYDMSIGATHQFRYSAITPGFRPTRRWETDQCW